MEADAVHHAHAVHAPDVRQRAPRHAAYLRHRAGLVRTRLLTSVEEGSALGAVVVGVVPLRGHASSVSTGHAQRLAALGRLREAPGVCRRGHHVVPDQARHRIRMTEAGVDVCSNALLHDPLFLIQYIENQPPVCYDDFAFRRASSSMVRAFGLYPNGCRFESYLAHT